MDATYIRRSRRIRQEMMDEDRIEEQQHLLEEQESVRMTKLCHWCGWVIAIGGYAIVIAISYLLS